MSFMDASFDGIKFTQHVAGSCFFELGLGLKGLEKSLERNFICENAFYSRTQVTRVTRCG